MICFCISVAHCRLARQGPIWIPFRESSGEFWHGRTLPYTANTAVSIDITDLFDRGCAVTLASNLKCLLIPQYAAWMYLNTVRMSEGETVMRGPSRQGLFVSLRVKMTAYFGLLFIITLIIVQWVEIYGFSPLGFDGEYQREQSEVFRNLNLVADLKKERLDLWLRERRDDAKVLSENDITASHVADLITLVRESTASAGQGEELWAEIQEKDNYQALIQHLNLVKSAYGIYEAVQVADGQTGIIIASTRNIDLGFSVFEQDYFDNVLSFNDTHINMEKDMWSNEYDLNISNPIRMAGEFGDGENKIIAVLIIHVRANDFIQPLLHTGGGLGQTGEALLVNQDVRILTSLKHPLADGSIARPLEHQIEARPAVLAAQGQEGIITTDDYRDAPVLAAYRHVRVTSQVGWGLVVKRDEAEVFAPLQQKVERAFFIGLVSTLALAGFTFLIATNLARPIRHLSQTVRQVEGGDLSARSPLRTSDEVGVLAMAFNAMIERVQKWGQELEEQVEIRTAELNETNTELKREIIERVRAEADLEELNQSLEEMIYVTSHDLRSPLVSMEGYAGELLEEYEGKLDDNGVYCLIRLKANSQRMHTLVLSLLDVSRLNTQKFPHEPFDPQKLLENIVHDLSLTIEQADANVEIRDMPGMYGDKQRMAGVFRNLISNAITYGGKSIVVGFKEGAYYVQDDGIGIPKDQFEKIFKPGERLKIVEAEGVGMGLTFCKKVVNQHGGTMWAESEGANKGATLYFVLDA